MRQKTDLRAYQQRLATHLYEHDNTFCVVRPGGGKTISALTAIEEMLKDGVIRHALVIAPKRVARYVWPDEIEAWAHTADLRFAVLTGTPTQRLHALAKVADRQITIIGIDLVKWLLETLDNVSPNHPVFDLLVIDEVSKLRAPTGVRSQLLAKNAKRWKMIWGLSGTLRPSSALDLFMPARVVTKGALWGRSFYKWRGEYFYPTDWNQYNWAAKPDAEAKLNADIAPWIATIQQEEMAQLPELSIVFDHVELPADARAEYDRMHSRLVAIAGGNDPDDATVVAANAAVATGKLAQIANGFVYGEGGNTDARAMHDEKRQWLQDLIDDTARPTLLVYEFREDLDMMRELLGRDLPYLGAGATDRYADLSVKAWNAGELKFMALHPASAGHGLNLQHGGSDMAWIAPTWSPELWEQTIARLHRSGQKAPVMVRVCVARDTVDEMKIDRVHHKMTAQAAFEAYLRRHGK